MSTEPNIPETKTLQAWPRGTIYTYRDHGNRYEVGEYPKRADGTRIGGQKMGWRNATDAEALEIRIEEIARRYQDREVLACQSSLVDEMLKLQVQGAGDCGDLAEAFSIDNMVNLTPDARNWTAAQCREWLSDEGHDAIDVPEIECEDCAGLGIEDEPAPCATCKDTQSVPDPDADDDDTYLESLRDAVRENAESADIYEWWLVSDWLAGKLADAGIPVLRNDYGDWWGRTCTGQQFIMDGTLQQVARMVEESIASRR